MSHPKAIWFLMAGLCLVLVSGCPDSSRAPSAGGSGGVRGREKGVRDAERDLADGALKLKEFPPMPYPKGYDKYVRLLRERCGVGYEVLQGPADSKDLREEARGYLAHAPMEPINCVADVRADRCEVWVGTQFQTGDRDAAAAESGLKPEQVTLHTTLLGGGFGRRAVPDSHFVREAVQLSRAVRAPVKVIWTREDDTRGGYYRPRAYHTVRAGLDAAGSLVAWEQHVVVQSFLADTPFAALIKNGIDETAVEGAREIPYAIPNLRVDWHQAPGGVPTLWWRSVGHSHTAFVVETLIDELAHAAGKDPVAFRRGLLGKQPRVKRVLEFVADKAGWGQPLPAGQGRGIAVHESFGSYVAHVADVSVSDAGRVRVHRRNGGKTLEQLVEHVTQDKLVRWGWEPGDGRTKPPLSHEEFAQKFHEWVEKGAASPE
jgi:hypothetical protein